ncbi:hypothetical protein LI184_02545 [Erysipelatoclostridium ramosum]|uniref:hypothetical protein n=1 Tax=Thomasclavelia ramosa TaxID=1547 RepID=UPI001D06653D|nr:hypothetical protein [Thomasclavelia ramosa]MCB6555377.1 hypothetical protein [Thomasclavelia ramosa]
MDNYTMDELILAFALKFENNAPVILQRLFEGTPVSVEEIDEILKKVEEKYVVITSDDYPDFFHRVDNPSFVFFYEGNLELFDQCDHYFEKTVDGRKCYLAINQKGNDVDWCIVTENEKQLVPEINKFFEDYGDRYNLKNYVKKEGECDWMIGCENQEHLNDLIEKVQSELKILNFKDYSKEKDLTMS